MPSRHDFLEKAEKHYSSANHLLNTTLPAIKDPKLLLGVVENIFLCLESAIDALLFHDRELLLISPPPKSFEGKLAVFQTRTAPRNKIDSSFVDLAVTMKELMELHKKTPIEFRRKDAFIITGKDYRLRPLTAPLLAQQLEKTKQFLEYTKVIIEKYRHNPKRE